MKIKSDRVMPKNVTALMWGPILQREKVDGSGKDDQTKKFPLWFFWKEPAFASDKVIAHRQNHMRWGIFIHTGEKSTCLHLWFHWKKQVFSKNPDGGSSWKSNTEKGIYCRTPGHRWDLEEGMIRTGGYFGSHWD